jgi:hypothetical protein
MFDAIDDDWYELVSPGLLKFRRGFSHFFLSTLQVGFGAFKIPKSLFLPRILKILLFFHVLRPSVCSDSGWRSIFGLRDSSQKEMIEHTIHRAYDIGI